MTDEQNRARQEIAGSQEPVVEGNLAPAKSVEFLAPECEELLKIFSASLATAKANR